MKIIKRLNIIILLLFIFLLSSASFSEDDPFLLTSKKAWKLSIGETIDNLYLAYGKKNTKLTDLFLEGTFSPAVEIYINTPVKLNPSLIAEISFNKNLIISRITVLDPKFKYKDQIGIGSKIEELKKIFPNLKIESGEGKTYAVVNEIEASFEIDTSNGLSERSKIKSVLLY